MDPKQGVRILIMALVTGLVLWGLWLIMTLFPVPHPVNVVIIIIFALVFLSVVLRQLGLW